MRALGLLFLLLPALAQNLAPAFQLDCRFRGRPGPPRSSGTGAPWGPAPSRSGLLRAATFSACARGARGDLPGLRGPGGGGGGGLGAFTAELLRYDPRGEALKGGKGLVYALAYGPKGVLALGDAAGQVRLLPRAVPPWTSRGTPPTCATWPLAPTAATSPRPRGMGRCACTRPRAASSGLWARARPSSRWALTPRAASLASSSGGTSPCLTPPRARSWPPAP